MFFNPNLTVLAMVSNSITTASMSSGPNARDLGKKKRVRIAISPFLISFFFFFLGEKLILFLELWGFSGQQVRQIEAVQA